MQRPKRTTDDIKEALDSPERGSESYPDYHYLWHLAAIEAIDLAAAGPGWRVERTIWADERLSKDPAIIALIDTGLADHPNLKNRVVWEKAVDFGTAEGGATYPRDNVLAGTNATAQSAGVPSRETPVDLPPFAELLGQGKTPEEVAQHLVGRLPGLSKGMAEAATELLRRTVKRRAVHRHVTFQDQRFPSHGTATAGLAVGTPLLLGGGFSANAYPYFGVDPFSRIIPIATSPEPEPAQLTRALLYAVAAEAHVILLPRGADDPRKAPRPDPRDKPGEPPNQRTRYDRLEAGWDLFEAVLVAVSKRIPVVCAAGNSGDAHVEFPASLAADAENGIIAVGAVTPIGMRSGYACYGDGLTIVAPSSDGIVYDRYQLRLDPEAAEAIDHFWRIHDYPDEAYVEYCHESPLTIDIPGPRGYRSGIAVRPGGAPRDLDSMYTLFGGTSAAAAQVAGVLALMWRAAAKAGQGASTSSGRAASSTSSGPAAWNGPAAKAILAANARDTILGNPLTAGRANRSDRPDDAGFWGRQFGSGLVSARLAVAAAGNLPAAGNGQGAAAARSKGAPAAKGKRATAAKGKHTTAAKRKHASAAKGKGASAPKGKGAAAATARRR